jgi:peptidoglycan/LPS O-acetylase OafA/YrhL
MPRYFFWVDGLRGVAALCVVVFHYHHFYLDDWQGRSDLPALTHFPYARFVWPIYEYGHYAVELFWVISGFVFAHVYLQRPIGMRQFWGARFARLYPLHLVMLLVVVTLQFLSMRTVGHWEIYGNNDLRHFLLQIVMASNWTTLSRGLSFNGPIWSVSLEVMAYGFFFVSLIVLRALPLLAVGLAALAFIAYEFWPSDIPLVQPGVARCAGFFFSGVGLYVLISAQEGRWKQFFAFGTASLLVVTGICRGFEDMALVGFSLLFVLGAAVLDLRKQSCPVVFSFLGRTSYSLYLVHVPMQMFVLWVADAGFGGTRDFVRSLWVLPVYVLISVGLAYLANRWIEVPANHRLRNVLCRKQV